jgi:hypothetical protein
VPAFSNCNSDFTSNESNFVNVTLPDGSIASDLYTGMPWQCVEYGRRYWLMTRPHCTFGSVDGASDIWSALTVGFRVFQTPTGSTSDSSGEGGPSFPLEKHQNFNTSSPPALGDLLIYPVQPGGFPFGHVAVIVKVTQNTTANVDLDSWTFEVHLAEQNWDSLEWAHKSEGYSRQLTATYHVLTKKYSIWDPEGHIAGWVRRPGV